MCSICRGVGDVGGGGGGRGMRRVLLCMLEAAEGELCSLEVLR